jgi:energy-coupling factor transporter transmembrane protein EcfT
MKKTKYFYFLIFIVIGIVIILTNPIYASSILAILTYIYVLLTFFLLRSNNNALEEQLRPYVILTFPEIRSFVYVSLKNYGQRPALDIKIKISKGLEEFVVESVGENYINIFNQKFLAPNQEIKHFFTDVGYIYSPKNPNARKVFDIIINYKDSYGKEYEIDYSIDFSTQFDVRGITVTESNYEKHLENIYKELEKLNKNIDKYLRRV